MMLLLMLLAQPSDAFTRALARAPAPVRAFVERRDGCDHWGGEEAYDAARGREIDAAWRKLRCDRVPADEKLLRRRYARQPAILKLLVPQPEAL